MKMYVDVIFGFDNGPTPTVFQTKIFSQLPRNVQKITLLI